MTATSIEIAALAAISAGISTAIAADAILTAASVTTAEAGDSPTVLLPATGSVASRAAEPAADSMVAGPVDFRAAAAPADFRVGAAPAAVAVGLAAEAAEDTGKISSAQ
jgi:hypothetical protein